MVVLNSGRLCNLQGSISSIIMIFLRREKSCFWAGVCCTPRVRAVANEVENSRTSGDKHKT